MKLPKEVDNEFDRLLGRTHLLGRIEKRMLEAIVRDCAEQCHRNMYHGTTDIPTINAANHALSDCYKAILVRYGTEAELHTWTKKQVLEAQRVAA